MENAVMQGVLSELESIPSQIRKDFQAIQKIDVGIL